MCYLRLAHASSMSCFTVRVDIVRLLVAVILLAIVDAVPGGSSLAYKMTRGPKNQ